MAGAAVAVVVFVVAGGLMLAGGSGDQPGGVGAPLDPT